MPLVQQDVVEQPPLVQQDVVVQLPLVTSPPAQSEQQLDRNMRVQFASHSSAAVALFSNMVVGGTALQWEKIKQLLLEPKRDQKWPHNL